MKTTTETTATSIIVKKGNPPWYINCICVCPSCEQETQLTSLAKMSLSWRNIAPSRFAWTCENCDTESEYAIGITHEKNGCAHPRLKALNPKSA